MSSPLLAKPSYFFSNIDIMHGIASPYVPSSLFWCSATESLHAVPPIQPPSVLESWIEPFPNFLVSYGFHLSSFLLVLSYSTVSTMCRYTLNKGRLDIADHLHPSNCEKTAFPSQLSRLLTSVIPASVLQIKEPLTLLAENLILFPKQSF